MSIRDDFQTDDNKSAKGVWFDYPGYRLLIAHAGEGNPAYSKLLTKLGKPYRRQAMSNTLPEKVAKRINAEVLSRTVLLGWDGEAVQDADGNWVEYSQERAKKELMEVPALMAEVQERASELFNFQNDAEEAAEGNS